MGFLDRLEDRMIERAARSNPVQAERMRARRRRDKERIARAHARADRLQQAIDRLDARVQGGVPVATVEGSRPTLTRTGLGLLLGGPVGGLLGFAWRKKTKNVVRVRV